MDTSQTSASGYAGAEWVKSSCRVSDMSEFGAKVADLLGDVFAGIYHLDIKALHRMDWGSNRWIEITLHNDLSTFDSNYLTRLVVLCHDRLIRCEIHGKGPHYLTLGFSPRISRDGTIYERHPTIEQAVDSIRRNLVQIQEPLDGR